MSIKHLVNSKGSAQASAATKAAKQELEQGITQTDRLSAIDSGIHILNERFEEAFKTGLNDEDIHNGND